MKMTAAAMVTESRGERLGGGRNSGQKRDGVERSTSVELRPVVVLWVPRLTQESGKVTTNGHGKDQSHADPERTCRASKS